MPVYNGMPYLPKAVESIVNQTFQDWELVLVNDGSTDGTRAYVESLQDQRIKPVHLESNRGLTGALNAGLEHCRGDYTARMDGDDICLPDRFQLQVDYLQRQPEVGLVGGQFIPLGERRSGRLVKLPLTSHELEDALFNNRHAICHPTAMFRTQLVRDLGGYWEPSLGEEVDLFLRVAEHSQLANLDQPVLLYRVHGGSLNGRRLREMHQHFAYAVHSARCRRQGSPPLEMQAFLNQHEQRSIFQRLPERLDFFALAQYQSARINILGSNPLLGYLKMAAAATCSPRLTTHRILRAFRGLRHNLS